MLLNIDDAQINPKLIVGSCRCAVWKFELDHPSPLNKHRQDKWRRQQSVPTTIHTYLDVLVTECSLSITITCCVLSDVETVLHSSQKTMEPLPPHSREEPSSSSSSSSSSLSSSSSSLIVSRRRDVEEKETCADKGKG